jgi:hypothetical protein
MCADACKAHAVRTGDRPRAVAAAPRPSRPGGGGSVTASRVEALGEHPCEEAAAVIAARDDESARALFIDRVQEASPAATNARARVASGALVRSLFQPLDLRVAARVVDVWLNECVARLTLRRGLAVAQRRVGQSCSAPAHGTRLASA